MGLKDSLDKLMDGALRPAHGYSASTQTFAELDTDRLKKDMRLEARGEERGREQEPKSDADGLDHVEREIVDKIEQERKASYNALLDQTQIYQERIAALDFEGRFAVVKSASVEAVAEFRVEARRGMDRLHERRRQLLEVEEEQSEFRKDSRLKRTAEYSSGASLWLKVGFLFFVLAVETILNGLFLSKGSDYGIAGGVVEAFAFAALNVVATFLITHYLVRQTGHRSWGRKLVGVLGFLLFLFFACVLNLALAHYREVSSVLFETAGPEVVRRILSDPLGLTDIKSWLFFGIGLTFSFLIMVDVWYLDDRYPGYGRVARKLAKARRGYIEWKEHLLAELASIRDAAADALQEASKDIAKRRAEHDTILDQHSKLIRRYELHVQHLERAANSLLDAYRQANSKVRSTPVPQYFDRLIYKADSTTVREELKMKERSTELEKAIQEAQDTLGLQLQSIHDAYEGAAREYYQLDDLIAEIQGSTWR